MRQVPGRDRLQRHRRGNILRLVPTRKLFDNRFSIVHALPSQQFQRKLEQRKGK